MTSCTYGMHSKGIALKAPHLSAFGQRLSAALLFRATKLLARVPLRARSNRQLAREAVYLHGASQKPSELAPLLRLLRQRQPRIVVEIGTKHGGTLYALCQVAHERAVVVSIDLPGGDFGGGYEEHEIPGMRSFARGHQALHFLRSDSHDDATRQQLLQILDGRMVEFLLIDGDHSYNGVKTDYEMYAALTAEDALIAFHDVLPHPQVPECQVDRFWNEIKSDHVHHEFLDREIDDGWGQWGGIGVLEVAR